MISILKYKVNIFWLNKNALSSLLVSNKVFGLFIFIFLFISNSYSQEKSFGTYHSYDIDLPDNNLIKLQPIIDRADTGETIILEPGIYTGPVYIRTDGIVLDGQGQCVITGLDYQSVIYIESNNVHIKNFVITNSVLYIALSCNLFF